MSSKPPRFLPLHPHRPTSAYRRTYADGWVNGVVCGLCAGALAASLLWLLVGEVLQAWGCPAC